MCHIPIKAYPVEQKMKDNQSEQTNGTQTNEQTGVKTQAAGSLSCLLGEHLSSHLHLNPTNATPPSPPPLSQSIIYSSYSHPVGDQMILDHCIKNLIHSPEKLIVGQKNILCSSNRFFFFFLQGNVFRKLV